MSASDANNLHQSIIRNQQWAESFAEQNDKFFHESVKAQTPHTLWIGCSDSRVPESVITNANPGEIFVHRNIANQFNPEDNNVLSVVFYAVEKLGVEDIIIVGHSECGGAMACLNAAKNIKNISSIAEGSLATLPPDPAQGITAASPINRWLESLTRHTATLQLEDENDPLQKVVEENVKLQVKKLVESDVMKHAWGTSKKTVKIHGWFYDLATGRLRDLDVSVPAS